MVTKQKQGGGAKRQQNKNWAPFISPYYYYYDDHHYAKKKLLCMSIWMVSLFCFALYITYILYRRSKQTNDHYHYVENKKKIMFLFIFTYFLSFSLTFFFIFTSHKLNILWIIRWNVIRNIWNMESLYRRKKCNKNDFLLCLNSFVNLT